MDRIDEDDRSDARTAAVDGDPFVLRSESAVDHRQAIRINRDQGYSTGVNVHTPNAKPQLNFGVDRILALPHNNHKLNIPTLPIGTGKPY